MRLMVRKEGLEKLYCMSILDRLSYDVSLLCVPKSLKSIWVRVLNPGGGVGGQFCNHTACTGF